MRILILTIISFSLYSSVFGTAHHFQQTGPIDSVYLLAYSKDEGRSGMLLAWSLDQEDWNSIGPHHRFLFSDFGTWGGQKRMFDPYLFQEANGIWHCVWKLNDGIQQFAHSTSTDLIKWNPQVYPYVVESGNVDNLEINSSDGGFVISWLNEGQLKGVETSDFKKFSQTISIAENTRLNNRIKAEMNGQTYKGNVNKVSWSLIENLIKHYEWSEYHESQRRETLLEDHIRFAELKPVEIKVGLKPEKSKKISDMLMGIFFEDISYAADGGLYAEMVQNRDFEYHPRDHRMSKPEWNSRYAWTFDGSKEKVIIQDENPIHANNPNYIVLQGKSDRGLVNEGWDGMSLKAGERYNFSVFARSLDASKKSFKVRLTDESGANYGETTIKKVGADWKKFKASITCTKSLNSGRLEIIPIQDGKLALDIISLFPENTFKGRPNGLRADLAQTIADLNPTFIRFPGGCVAHGDGLDNIYRWKNSVGPLEARVPMSNIWGYHQSLGLGYYEYFQFCEDISAQPVPVLAAGVPCQNSQTGGHGQCGGIPMEDMDEYVQDILDLIEWANGDKTTKWGKVRSEAGHPKPFNLKYVGIGNEDLITDIFAERFTMIYQAITEKYPDIEVIGTSGPFYTGSDYEFGWKLAKELEVPLVDEHYYVPPGWFINNQDFYDKYDRNGPKVYLGEYAAHVPGRRMNIETALSEALYLTNVERNGDVVSMTSFAPLLAKERHTDWNPDLIYFNNSEVKPTVDYYVQKLFGQNVGDEYIPNSIQYSNWSKEVTKRINVSVAKDSETGDFIVKLVNLLPVAVTAELDLSDLNITDQPTTVTVLSGEPKDEKARPREVSDVTVKSQMIYEMEPYSFVVFRVKGE